ncbi:MAG: hypothetical protein QHI48_06045 [Bacteroidota bacterium]|nr:hypothetical protein [Bacteroidota bacterium]
MTITAHMLDGSTVELLATDCIEVKEGEQAVKCCWLLPDQPRLREVLLEDITARLRIAYGKRIALGIEVDTDPEKAIQDLQGRVNLRRFLMPGIDFTDEEGRRYKLNLVMRTIMGLVSDPSLRLVPQGTGMYEEIDELVDPFESGVTFY